MNRLKELETFGQSPWLDYIRRDILLDGTLQRLVEEDGIGGLTSNPAIFQQAIAESDLYDAAIHQILTVNRAVTIEELYEKLAVEDIQLAADILRPTFEATQGVDGYVSLEVSPHLARNAEGSVSQAFAAADGAFGRKNDFDPGTGGQRCGRSPFGPIYGRRSLCLGQAG